MVQCTLACYMWLRTQPILRHGYKHSTPAHGDSARRDSNATHGVLLWLLLLLMMMMGSTTAAAARFLMVEMEVRRRTRVRTSAVPLNQINMCTSVLAVMVAVMFAYAMPCIPAYVCICCS